MRPASLIPKNWASARNKRLGNSGHTKERGGSLGCRQQAANLGKKEYGNKNVDIIIQSPSMEEHYYSEAEQEGILRSMEEMRKQGEEDGEERGAVPCQQRRAPRRSHPPQGRHGSSFRRKTASTPIPRALSFKATWRRWREKGCDDGDGRMQRWGWGTMRHPRRKPKPPNG